MKQIIKILYIIIFIVVLSGCNGQKNIEEDFDISIISTDKISLFKQQNGSITLQKKVKRNDNFSFLKENYFNLKDKMFIKTTVIGKKTLLAKINKNTLNIDLKKDDSEPYTFTYYENKIYATTVFTDKFNIIEYDDNFKEIKKKEIKKEGVNITNDIQVYKDNIFILGGNIDKNSKIRNLIWKFDMNFNLLEEIDLNYGQGTYLRFYIKDDIIYISQNSHGLTEKNEPKGSNKILKYSINNKSKEFITLKYTYPLNIYPDQDNLIIEHYSLYVPNYRWTILNTKNNVQKNIYFNDRPKNEDKPPFFNQDKINYYFLFYDKLYVYNKETLEETMYNLSDYNISNADILITKKGD